MERRRPDAGAQGYWLVAGLGLVIAIAGFPAGAPGPAFAETAADADDEEAMDPAAIKAQWQARFRDLRLQEAQLIQTIELATKEYADSNRRNYRRSGVRHFHRTNANEAKLQLAAVQTKIERMFDEVVAAGGSLNWLYEVDDEPIDPSSVSGLGDYGDEGRFGGKGAYAPADEDEQDADEASPDDDPDAGRNPLYTREADEDDLEADLEAGDVPASAEEKPRPGFDYDSWREDRSRYERERAEERHLEPDDY